MFVSRYHYRSIDQLSVVYEALVVKLRHMRDYQMCDESQKRRDASFPKHNIIVSILAAIENNTRLAVAWMNMTEDDQLRLDTSQLLEQIIIA